MMLQVMAYAVGIAMLASLAAGHASAAPAREVTMVAAAAAAPEVSAPAPAAVQQTTPQPARASQSAPATLPPVTVRVLPLDTARATDADHKAQLERLYSSLLAKLRAMPELTVLAPDSAGYGGAARYEISMKGAGGGPCCGVAGVEYGINDLDVSRVRVVTTADGRRMAPASSQADVVDLNAIPPNLLQTMSVVTGQYGPRNNQEHDLDSFVDRVWSAVHVSDPSLMAYVRDARLDFTQRLRALNTLLGSFQGSFGVQDAVDPDIIRAGVALASTATDPALRLVIWKQLGQTRSPELVAPLVRALGTEKDANVRISQVGILSRTYSADPQARAALDEIARTDPRQLTRMAAQRGLTDEKEWNDYVAATLADTALTDTQRLAPLGYLYASGPFSGPVLDDAALRTLGNLLAGMQTLSTEADGAVWALSMSKSVVATEVLVRILIPAEGQPRAGQPILDRVLMTLPNKNLAEPRVRAVLEQIAANQSDSWMRTRARALLETSARQRR